MPQFLVSQTVEFEVVYLIEAESEEDAQENSGEYFDENKIIDIGLSGYDSPWDINTVDSSEKFEFLSQEQLEPYKKVRIV